MTRQTDQTAQAQDSKKTPETDRRTFLRTVGLAATVAATGAASTSSVTADTVVPSSDWNPIDDANNLIKFATGTFSDALGALRPDLTEVTAVSFWQTATSAYSAWSQTKTIQENWLKDFGSILNIRARNAVADAYEEGLSEPEAVSRAHTAIAERADIPYKNLYIAKQANLLHAAYISETARQTEGLTTWQGPWFTPADTDYSGSGNLTSSNLLGSEEDLRSINLELPSGATTEVQSVSWRAEWDNGDFVGQGLSNDVLNSYDGSQFTIGTAQGNTLTVDLEAEAPAVPDSNLEALRAFDVRELAEGLQAIEDKVSTLQSNYGSTFVSDIYTALDNGNITTTQLRGVEALASLLSGTTDATESRYQLALSTLRDIPRPDLSEASWMEAEVSGWSEVRVEVDSNGNRSFKLNSDLQGILSRGQIFAEAITANLKTEGRYLFDPLQVKYSAQHTAQLQSVSTGRVFAEYTLDPPPDSKDSHLDTDGEYVCMTEGNPADFADRDHVVQGFDIQGSTIFRDNSTWGTTGVPRQVEMPGDGHAYIIDRDVKFTKVEMETGNIVFRNQLGTDTDDARGLVLDPNNDKAIFTDGTGSVYGVSMQDGSKLWEKNLFSGKQSSSFSTPDYWVIPSGDWYLINKSDQSTQTVSSPRGSFVDQIDAEIFRFADGNNDEIVDVNITNGNEVETYSHPVSGSSFGSAYPGDSLLRDDGDGNGWKVVDINGNVEYTVGQSFTALKRQDSLPADYFDKYDGIVFDGLWTGTNLNTESDDYSEYLINGGEIEIIGMQNADGESVDEAQTDKGDANTDWGAPEYETLNNEELANRLDELASQYSDALEDAGSGNVNVDIPSFGLDGALDGLPTIPGFTFVESVVIVVLGYFGLSALTNS